MYFTVRRTYNLVLYERSFESINSINQLFLKLETPYLTRRFIIPTLDPANFDFGCSANKLFYFLIRNVSEV